MKPAPIPMAAINSGLTNFLNSLSGANAVLLGALLGGMMAIDMGGPFNKTICFRDRNTCGDGCFWWFSCHGDSYGWWYGTTTRSFVATLLFKNKFTKEEQDSGLTNIVMGLSFITEGAIPFGT